MKKQTIQRGEEGTACVTGFRREGRNARKCCHHLAARGYGHPLHLQNNIRCWWKKGVGGAHFNTLGHIWRREEGGQRSVRLRRAVKALPSRDICLSDHLGNYGTNAVIFAIISHARAGDTLSSASTPPHPPIQTHLDCFFFPNLPTSRLHLCQRGVRGELDSIHGGGGSGGGVSRFIPPHNKHSTPSNKHVDAAD